MRKFLLALVALLMVGAYAETVSAAPRGYNRGYYGSRHYGPSPYRYYNNRYYSPYRYNSYYRNPYRYNSYYRGYPYGYRGYYNRPGVYIGGYRGGVGIRF